MKSYLEQRILFYRSRDGSAIWGGERADRANADGTVERREGASGNERRRGGRR